MESNHADLQKTRADASGKVADIHTAAKIIRDRGVVIYPAETVYGIGADALVRDCGAKGVCNKEAILPGIACGIQLRDDRGCFSLRCGYDGTDPKTPAGPDHGDP